MHRSTRREILLAARQASARGLHAEAAKLFALVGISYVHEIQVYEPKHATN